MKAVLGTVAGICALAIGFIVLFRYAVPLVLEAHFAGSLITASVLGVGGVLALVWAAWRLWCWSAPRLNDDGDSQ